MATVAHIRSAASDHRLPGHGRARRDEMTTTRVLARNTVLNVAGQGVPMLAALISIPILIGHLGPTRFGVLTSPSLAGSSPSSTRSCLIRSCIVLLYISALMGPVFAVAQGPTPMSPDQLYADRANLDSAQRAARLWEDLLSAHPTAFEAA